MGRAVARQSKSSMVSEVFKDTAAKKYVMKKIGILVRREIVQMCSDKTKSILSSQSMSDLKDFTWDKLLTELSANAPTLLSILQSCTHTRKTKPNHNAVIGMCCAIILKYHFSKMSMVQKIMSLILYAGNSGKQVDM